uniref:RRM domain-containing protein n=1 Tax=Anser cygnoides TaxID=8845 RepID=A0A8B9EH58_ANSCY
MNSGGIGVPLGFPLGPTSVIQVTNLSSAVTSEQMRTLFGFLGDIEELQVYCNICNPIPFAGSVDDAQELTEYIYIYVHTLYKEYKFSFFSNQALRYFRIKV